MALIGVPASTVLKNPELATRSQFKLAADLGGTRSVGRAEAQTSDANDMAVGHDEEFEKLDWDWDITAKVEQHSSWCEEGDEHLFEPVTFKPTTEPSKVPAKTDSYRKSVRGRGESEAQVPGSTPVLTPQQLNSRRHNVKGARDAVKVAENVAKQNARRAKLRAAEKRPLDGAGVSQPSSTCSAACEEKSEPGTRPERLLGAVAAFWERKKARSSTDLPS